MVSLHHFQVSTYSYYSRVAQFQSQFGFNVFAHSSSSPPHNGVALYINSVVMIVTAAKRVAMEASHDSDDWISDIVLHTSNDKQFQEMQKRITHSHTSDIIKTHSHTTSDIEQFKLSTPFHSVLHTIQYGDCNCVRSKDYCTSTDIKCIPGYSWCPLMYDRYCDICCQHFNYNSTSIPRGISHVDHVTFACQTNTSDNILKWYEDYLGFQKFKVNSMDNGDGFIVEGNNGMRMLAMEYTMEYWRCSEVGAKIDGMNKEEPVQLVFAEPLPNSRVNQVQTFLTENKGPGVQHIAFRTDNIVGVVSSLRTNLVPFITPPPEYYTLFEKLEQIKKAKKEVLLLQQNNILIDFEGNGSDSNTDVNYLMQVFSHPLFGKNTFFIEIIQRCGARGFGAGNITALWKALEIHLSSSK